LVEKKYNIYIEDGVHEVKPKKKDRKDKHVRGKIVFYLKDQWSANTGRYEYIFFSRSILITTFFCFWFGLYQLSLGVIALWTASCYSDCKCHNSSQWPYWRQCSKSTNRQKSFNIILFYLIRLFEHTKQICVYDTYYTELFHCQRTLVVYKMINVMYWNKQCYKKILISYFVRI